MANNIGYEKLTIGPARAAGTTAAIRASAVCAIFFVDPESSSTVRYRSDQTDPTANMGVPLRPGKSIVVAGRGNVMNARFIAEGGTAEIHAMYYDQVDVVDLGLTSDPSWSDVVTAVKAQTAKLEELGRSLRQIRNATGYVAFSKIGDDIPDGDR